MCRKRGIKYTKYRNKPGNISGNNSYIDIVCFNKKNNLTGL